MRNELGKETIPADEARYFESLARRLTALICEQYSSGLMRRDAHPKMHGLVKAEFVIEANLPSHLQVGIFKLGGSWPAWIRFSNQSSTIQDDIKGDIRGMAVKIMGVPGKKILTENEDALTQDFITISTPVFITRTPQEFDELVSSLMGSGLDKIKFFLTNLHATRNLLRSNKKFANPLQIQYFSTTPYQFGKTAAKYSIRPHSQGARIPNHPSADYLREAMVAQLKQEEVCFDFLVQLQTDAASQPIEDPSVAWDETAAPYYKLATIRIPAQDFDTQARREYGENLSFNPWHSLPEHRPLGGINRARRVVYTAISRFRHEKNQVARTEPKDFDIP